MNVSVVKAFWKREVYEGLERNLEVETQWEQGQ